MDIVTDGVVLFAEPGVLLAEPKQLSPTESLRETQDYFEEWFESATDFFSSASDAAAKGKGKLAAFLLHQATERFYHCIFLVRTLYSPKTHNLNRLRALTEQLEPSLRTVWPVTDRTYKKAYNLLREAYIKARYSREYEVSASEIEWLSKRIGILQSLTYELCSARVTELQNRLSAT